MDANCERVSHFIRLVRGISPAWMRYACTHGACHRFHLLLKDRFPSAEAYIVREESSSHIVSKIFGVFWDIYGEWPKSQIRPQKMRLIDHRCMSSCHFDEVYVMHNPSCITAFDKEYPPSDTY